MNYDNRIKRKEISPIAFSDNADNVERFGHVKRSDQIANIMISGMKLEAFKGGFYDLVEGQDHHEVGIDPTRNGMDFAEASQRLHRFEARYAKAKEEARIIANKRSKLVKKDSETVVSETVEK
ncbi:hypothetical protein [Capybara microvirus Cap1_SP_108]|nr:hypothetical protein [Capybara microvirus Cap1_SP_108]